MRGWSRTPPGVRELKRPRWRPQHRPREGRTPPGVRELKRDHPAGDRRRHESHPSRGA